MMTSCPRSCRFACTRIKRPVLRSCLGHLGGWVGGRGPCATNASSAQDRVAGPAGKIAPFRTAQERCKNAEEHRGDGAET